MAVESSSTDRSRRISSRRRMVRVGFSVLVIAVFLGVPLARFLLAPEPAAEPVAPSPVAVGPVLRADAERTVRYSGNLTPDTNTIIVPRVSGRVTEMLVRDRQLVRAGEVVARIEDEVLRLQLAQARSAYEAALAGFRQAELGVRSQELEIARAEVDQALSTLDTARSNLDRTERLFQAEAISRSEYEQARERFEAAETEVENARRKLDIMEGGASDEELTMARANAEAAERQLELVQLRLDYASVTTPVAGTVAQVLAEAGQTVGPETPLLAVVNDRLIHAEIRVPERLYGAFLGSEGRMAVRVYPEAYAAGDPFVGTVTSVASMVDATSRTFEVAVAIPNDDARLRPGMYVNAVFVLDALPGALQVPDTAIYRRADRDVVYALAGGFAREIPVTVLDIAGPTSVVSDGLIGDERLIVEGAAFLSDGAAVEVVEQR